MKNSVLSGGALLVALFAGIGSSANALDIPASVVNYLKEGNLTEDQLLSDIENKGKAFAEFVVLNRVAILDQFTTIAPSPREQRLLIAAMEFAASAEYVTTLDKLCDLRDQGQIDGGVLVFAFRAAAVRMGFLAYNYQNSTVQTLVKRAKALAPDDADFQDYLNDILNGSLKVRLEPYFVQDERPEPEILE